MKTPNRHRGAAALDPVVRLVHHADDDANTVRGPDAAIPRRDPGLSRADGERPGLHRGGG